MFICNACLDMYVRQAIELRVLLLLLLQQPHAQQLLTLYEGCANSLAAVSLLALQAKQPHLHRTSKPAWQSRRASTAYGNIPLTFKGHLSFIDISQTSFSIINCSY